MNVTRKLAATVAAAAVVSGGAFAAVEAAAATATSHTIKLTAVQLKGTQTRSAFMQTEKDLQHGKVTGFDSVSCVFKVKLNKVSCDAGFARADGMIYVHALVGQSGHGSGTVTGGTRSYKGATGTITLAPGSDQNHTKITIVYKR